MTIEEREKLFRLSDGSDAAITRRLRAAREIAGFKRQKEFAEALEINYQTYHSQEKRGRPTHSTVRFLYRSHRIDFNFIYNGDFSQLPGDVQVALEKALCAADS